MESEFGRAIYQRCLDLGIVSTGLFNELERLYKERNKVIHRFIITDIRSEDIFNLAVEYEGLYDKIDAVILVLEKKTNGRRCRCMGKEPKYWFIGSPAGAFIDENQGQTRTIASQEK